MDLEAKVDAILKHLQGQCAGCFGSGRIYTGIKADGSPTEQDCWKCAYLRPHIPRENQ